MFKLIKLTAMTGILCLAVIGIIDLLSSSASPPLEELYHGAVQTVENADDKAKNIKEMIARITDKWEETGAKQENGEDTETLKKTDSESGEEEEEKSGGESEKDKEELPPSSDNKRDNSRSGAPHKTGNKDIAEQSDKDQTTSSQEEKKTKKLKDVLHYSQKTETILGKE